MSLDLYNKTSTKLSELLTNSYSTSFSWGIMAFKPEFREPIYSVYGYVRLADEIVDTFHNYDKRCLLEKFRKETHEAINIGISTNPIIHAFQHTVNHFKIDINLIDAFLDSMEMDLTEKSYSDLDYDKYVFGSAEAVGLMCLKVFTMNNPGLYEELIHPAKMLGSAFQKVNFLRDIKSDLDERGRIYFPGIHSKFALSNETKELLENTVAKEFNEALIGIKKLPIDVKLGVYSAYLYYYFLFKKIKSLDISELLNKRVRISNSKKLLLLFKSVIEVKVLKLT